MKPSTKPIFLTSNNDNRSEHFQFWLDGDNTLVATHNDSNDRWKVTGVPAVTQETDLDEVRLGLSQSRFDIDFDTHTLARKLGLFGGGGSSSKSSAVNEELFAAARQDDLPGVKSALRRGAKANAKTEYGGYTALSLAVKNGSLEMVTLLLNKGAKISAPKENILIAAVDRDDEEVAVAIVKRLIGLGAKASRKDITGTSALNHALTPGVIDVLIANGAKKNMEVDSVFGTALCSACTYLKPAAVRRYLHHGANVDGAVGQYGYGPTKTPFCSVFQYLDSNVYGGDTKSAAAIEIMNILVEHDAKVGPDVLKAAADLAAENGIYPVLEHLVGMGAKCEPKHLNTFLVRAMKNGEMDKFDKYVGMGADVNGTDTEGVAMINRAAEYYTYHPEFFERLLTMGVRPHPESLFYATDIRLLDRLVKEFRIDPNAKEEGGGTALHKSCDSPGKTLFLLSAGANPDAKRAKETPLYMALYYKYVSTALVLVLWGAKFDGVPGNVKSKLKAAKKKMEKSKSGADQDIVVAVKALQDSQDLTKLQFKALKFHGENLADRLDFSSIVGSIANGIGEIDLGSLDLSEVLAEGLDAAIGAVMAM